MAVTRIEKIDKAGMVVQTCARHPDGKFRVFLRGTNMDAAALNTLDEVADFLRKNPRGGVRMNPGWSRIVERIHIDGIPR